MAVTNATSTALSLNKASNIAPRDPIWFTIGYFLMFLIGMLTIIFYFTYGTKRPHSESKVRRLVGDDNISSQGQVEKVDMFELQKSMDSLSDVPSLKEFCQVEGSKASLENAKKHGCTVEGWELKDSISLQATGSPRFVTIRKDDRMEFYTQDEDDSEILQQTLQSSFKDFMKCDWLAPEAVSQLGVPPGHEIAIYNSSMIDLAYQFLDAFAKPTALLS